MSHFSKIKTNISDIEILKVTLNDLGFNYKLFTSSQGLRILDVYKESEQSKSLFHFIWDGSQYNLMADFMLWSLTVNINSFAEKLNQQYAYNMILKQGRQNGFDKQLQTLMSDGSIRLVMQRWSN